MGTNKLPGEPNIAGLAVGLVVLALIFVVCSVIIVAVLIYKWKKDAYNKDNAVTNPYYCYATHQGLGKLCTVQIATHVVMILYIAQISMYSMM